MELSNHASRARAGCASRRRARQLAAFAVLLLSGWPTGEAARQPGELFTAVSLDAVAVGASPIARDTLTLRRRLVTIDLGQLAPAADAATLGGAAGTGIAPRGVLTLNLFEDAVFTGLVERTAPTFSGGQSLSGRLAGIEMGTMTLVVNGEVVAGTVRTPEATYRIRPWGTGCRGQPDRSGAAAAAGRADSPPAGGRRSPAVRTRARRTTGAALRASPCGCNSRGLYSRFAAAGLALVPPPFLTVP